jgi:dolichol-phosphate mannosyltransferase
MNPSKKNPVYLSIVFSFRNEVDVLAELVGRTRAVMKEARQKGLIINYQMIFVNDASSDNSLALLLE